MKHYIITIAITLLMSLHIMAAGKSDEAQASSKINHFTWGAPDFVTQKMTFL
jgi:hypothetical protein